MLPSLPLRKLEVHVHRFRCIIGLLPGTSMQCEFVIEYGYELIHDTLGFALQLICEFVFVVINYLKRKRFK